MKTVCETPIARAAGQRRVLKLVLAVNAGMLVVEFTAGLTARSTSLLADSVDILGDTIVYDAP